MKQRKWIALLLVAAMLLSLAACGGGKEEAKKEKDISGFYELRSATVGGEAVDGGELAWRGYDLFVWLKEEGDAVFFNGTALIYGTWKNGKLTTDDGQTLSFTVDGRTLTMVTDEGELVFKRITTQTDLDDLQAALDTPPEIGYFLFESSEKEDFNGEGAFVLLNADGTGWVCNGRKVMDVTWADGSLTLTYPEFSMDIPDPSYHYTVEGDKLMFTMGTADDEGNPVEYSITFRRTDEAEPDIDALKEALSNPSGYFVLTSVTYGETTISMADFADYYEIMPFLLLYDDGTGVFYDSTALYDLTWGDGNVYLAYMDDEATPYTFNGTTFSVSDGDTAMVFMRSDGEIPDIDALREEPTATGNLAGTYCLYMAELNGELTDDLLEATLNLSEDGSATYTIEGGTVLTGTWDDTTIVIGTVSYSYNLEDDGWLTITGSDGTFYFYPEENGATVDETSFWTNDWYGWWMVEDASGDYVEYIYMWWDLCARTEDYGDQALAVFWDEDFNSIDDPIGAMVFTHGETTFASDNGWFWLDEWDGDKELTCDLSESPASDMLVLSGTYTDENGSITYSLYLRPWGVKWDDTDDFPLPYYYDTWYLHQIEAGNSLPETFQP